ncbi:MAG: DUF192 domain-containing protein [Gemmatimonadota bacterium]
MRLTARNATRDRVLGDAVRVADSFASRARGLLGAERLPPGEGLWIARCRSIHSFGMRFAFDALFLDRGGTVIAVYRRFARNRVSRMFARARGVLELPAGTIEGSGTEVGDVIELLP